MNDKNTKFGCKSGYFSTATRKEVHSLANSLMKRLFKDTYNGIDMEELETPTETNNELTLERCISAFEIATPETETDIKDDLTVYDKTGPLSDNLKKLLNALKDISPTSVAIEREFSVSANFMTDRRTSLKHNTLDDLCFLKDFFRKEPKQLDIMFKARLN